VFETTARVLALNLGLVFHHFTRQLLLALTGLKMGKLRAIDFLVKKFVHGLDRVALVKSSVV